MQSRLFKLSQRNSQPELHAQDLGQKKPGNARFLYTPFNKIPSVLDQETSQLIRTGRVP